MVVGWDGYGYGYGYGRVRVLGELEIEKEEGKGCREWNVSIFIFLLCGVRGVALGTRHAKRAETVAKGYLQGIDDDHDSM